MAPSFVLRTVTTAGALDQFLPDFQSLDMSPVFCQAGTVVFKYPESGVNFDLLGEDLEIAVLMDGVEINQLRCVIEAVEGEDAAEAEDGSIWSFTCRTLLGLLDRAVVYPKNWPVAQPPTHDFVAASPGKVLVDLLVKVQGRGGLPILTWDFTATLDSAGVAWSTTVAPFDISFDAGGTYSEVLQTLVDGGLIEVRMSGRMLQAFRADTLGSDRSTGTAPLRFIRGRDIRESPRKISSREIATAVLLSGAENIYAEKAATGFPSEKWGRRETYYSANNVTSTSLLGYVGDHVLATRNRPIEEVTHGLLFELATNPRPVTSFDVGDWALSDVGRGWERYRIKQWVMAVDNNGAVTGTVVLNDLIAEQIKKLNDKLTRLNNGSASPGASDPEKDDGRVPKEPAAVILSTDYYLDNQVSRAVLTVDWAPVTENADGSELLNLSGYSVRWRYLGDALWRQSVETDTDETVMLFGNIRTDSVVEAQVRAKNRYNRYSLWTTPVQITTARDLVAPEKPEPPIVTSRVGTLRLTWSGLDYQGQQQVADFAGVEIHVGPNGTFIPDETTLRDFLSTRTPASTTLIEGLEYGTEYWVRLVAVDTEGNRSPASDETPTSHAILTPVVSMEIGTGVIGLSNTRFSDIGNLVDDGSFENAQVRTTRQLAMVGTRFYMDNSTASNGYYSIAVTGQPGAIDEVLLQAELPVKPGERIFGAADFKLSADTSSVANLILGVRWYNRDREIILPSGELDYESLTKTYSSSPPPKDGQWHTRISLTSRVAPEGATSFDLILEDRIHSTGTIWVDAIEVRREIDSLMIGEAVIQTAHIGLLQVNDAHIASASIGKLTTGTLTADLILSSRIKTADTGARVEINSGGLGAWNSSNVRTVNISSADGSVSILGQLVSGTSGRRIEINPNESSQIRFYPSTGNNYAFMGAVTEFSGGVAVNLTSGGYSSAGNPTVGRLWLSADPYESIKLGQVSTVDQSTNGAELWLGNAGGSLRYQFSDDDFAQGSLVVANVVKLSQINSNGSAHLQLANGVVTYTGRWSNFVYPLPNDGLFTGTQVTGTASAFSIAYGPTMSSTMVPMVTAHASNFGTGTPTVWGLQASSATGFTVAWNNNQGMRINFWCYRV